MGNERSSECPEHISSFRREKLLHEFRTFFDYNKNGCLEWKDFNLYRQNLCRMSGWKTENQEETTQACKVFQSIWEELLAMADTNGDGKITEIEWIKMWTNLSTVTSKKKTKVKQRLCPGSTTSSFSAPTDDGPTIPTSSSSDYTIPGWLDNYIEYRFNLFDRTRDGTIDIEEFEYVLSDFGVPARDAKNAFTIFSKNQEKVVDLEYFRELSYQYFLSDDPSDLGNFVTGRLIFQD